RDACHESDRYEKPGEKEVEEHPRRKDRRLDAAVLGLEAVFRDFFRLSARQGILGRRILAEDLHKPPKRQPVERESGSPPGKKLRGLRRIAQAELVDPDAELLGDGEVSQLMDDDERREDYE